MAKSLKKKQQQLKADQDLLTDRWTKVLAAEEYGLDRPAKGYKKHNSLPPPKKKVLKPHPDANTPRSGAIRRKREAASINLDATDISVTKIMMTPKTRQLVPDSAAPSPVSGKRTTQAHPARAAYSTNHVKFMVPLEWRPIIPMEHVGSSKQNSRPCAGNNEKRSQTMRSPDHQTS